MLYSFDIFDTILARKVRSPRGIFSLVQDKLIKEHLSDVPFCVVNNYFENRVIAEEQARAALVNDVCQEVTFDEIYDVFQRINQTSDVQTQLIKDIEIEIELDNIIPIESTVSEIKRLQKNGEHIVFISDMYLSQAIIRQLITKAIPEFHNIPIYVSSEYRKSKAKGDLYRFIKEEMNQSFQEWIHYGDNQHSDVNVPRALGIESRLVEKSSVGKWTRIVLEEQKDNVGTQYLLGASCKALNLRRDLDGEINYSFLAGAECCGTLFYPYVLWIINQALLKNITKLFFVARDGYLLKKIADKIIAYRKLPIQTSYLYGSRKAWRLPSISENELDMDQFIKWNYPRLITSYKKIADILELSVEELKEILHYDFDEETRISDEIKQEIFRRLVLEQNTISRYIVNKQEEKRIRVEKYLEQELRELNSKHCAFVELIGSGTTQRCLKSLVSKWNNSSIETFYYRLDDHKKYEGMINYSYFSNKFPFGNIIEVLCGAPHGQTIDYKFDNAIWEPIFGHDEGDFLRQYGFDEYENGLGAFVDEALKVDSKYDENLMDYKLPTRFYKILNDLEDLELYDYIANMPYGIRGIDGEVTCFAPALSDEDIKSIFYDHRDEPALQYYNGYMLDYSLRRLDARQRELVEYYKNLDKKQGELSDSNIHRTCKDLLGENIILYGAGKRGKTIYEKMILTGDKTIVAWADKNATEVEGFAGKVIRPYDIDGYKYDQVVITVANKKLSEEILEELVGIGINESRILWLPNY